MTISNPDQRAIILELAEILQNGGLQVIDPPRADLMMEKLKLSQESFMKAIKVLSYLELISPPNDLPHDILFTFSAACIEIAEQIKQEDAESDKPEDVVEIIKAKARSNRVIAGIIIGFFVLMTLVTFIHQTFGVLQDFGILKK